MESVGEQIGRLGGQMETAGTGELMGHVGGGQMDWVEKALCERGIGVVGKKGEQDRSG